MTDKKEYLDENYNLVYRDGFYIIPDGSTFASGDDFGNMVFRKDGFYFEKGEWKRTATTLDNSVSLGLNIVWQRNNKCADIDKEDPFHLDVDTTLSQRQSQYGSFANVAATTQNLYDLTRRDDMSNVQREALHMICSKLARIANGDPNHVDSWHDIAGYATLVVQDLEQ